MSSEIFSLYYDRAGSPITREEWAAAIEVEELRVVTWFGLAAFADGKPLIFESMVFGGKHDHDVLRYATEQEAREGHNLLVERELGVISPEVVIE